MRTLAAAAWLAARACLAHADDGARPPPDAAELSGSARAGVWGSSRTLDDDTGLGAASVWLKAAAKPSSAYRLYAEGYVAAEDVFDRAPGADRTRNMLREAYLDTRLDALDIRIGKQIIVWGRADRFNPTDNISPRDFTLLSVDDDDQRIGVPALKTDYHVGGVTLSALWLWDFRPNTVPVRRPAPGEPRVEVPVEREYRQGALKIDRTGAAVDWSVSYFSGFDLNPDVAPVLGPTPGVALHHHRIRVLGLDAATTVGRCGFRAETAYTKTEDTDGTDPFIKNPSLYTVLGVERVFGEGLTVNVQYLRLDARDYRGIDDLADPALRQVALIEAVISRQRDRHNRALALRISDRWLHQTLDGEITGAYSLNQGDYALRLKLKYALSDRWAISTGAEAFRGDAATYYGRLRDNSTYFAELKFGF